MADRSLESLDLRSLAAALSWAISCCREHATERISASISRRWASSEPSLSSSSLEALLIANTVTLCSTIARLSSVPRRMSISRRHLSTETSAACEPTTLRRHSALD